MAVNARTEEFQHIEVFDKPALFTNGRIARDIIKKGNRKKYCEKCAQRAYKAQQAEYARRKRAESKNRHRKSQQYQGFLVPTL